MTARVFTLPVALALLLAGPAAAQDSRLRTVPYEPDAVTVVKVVPGFVATVVLSPDERVESIAVGNSGAWEVSPSKSGDHVFVRPLSTGTTTNAEIITDTRHYTLLLQSTFDGDPEAAFQLRFDYASAAGPVPADAVSSEPGVARAIGMPGRYRLSGTRAIRPVAISDDGVRTQMAFDAAATMPAVYAVDAQGHETLVTLRRDGDVWIVDRLWPRYVFRLGKATVHARRFVERQPG